MCIGKIKVGILIPTRNCVDLIDRTIHSIKKQTFDAENIFVTIVDFSSVDGTYEKLLSYEKSHLGVYSAGIILPMDQMISCAQKFLKFCNFNDLTYTFTLSPGDTINSDFIQTCVELMELNTYYHPTMVMCESNVMKNDGRIVNQTPLYNRPFIFDGTKNMFDYLERGFNHKVICFGMSGLEGRKYNIHQVNDLTNWNKKFYLNIYRNAIYLPDCLACVKETIYDDELIEVVTNYANFIAAIRDHETQHNETIDKEDVLKACLNFSYNALLISSKELENNNRKNAEDCLLFSEVISQDICNTNAYQYLNNCIYSKEVYNGFEFLTLLPKDETWDPPAQSIILN